MAAGGQERSERGVAAVIDEPQAGRRTSLVPSRRPVADLAFRGLALASGLVVLVLLALIAWSTTQRGLEAFRSEGLIGFLTNTRWAPASDKFGGGAFIYGTLLISAVAIVLAVPVSLGIALFLTEVAPIRVRKPVTFLMDLLAAVPSVVFGLWGLLYLAPKLTGFYDGLHTAFGWIPLFGRLFQAETSGRSFLTAGIILALMIVPIITSISREVFDTTPSGQKEAALALGATRWEMIRGSVMPHSRAGVVSAVMLGLGRAMGETIAAALVIGSSARISPNLLGTGHAMAAVIASEFNEAAGTHRSALVALGVVLLGMTVLVNLGSKLIAGRAAH